MIFEDIIASFTEIEKQLRIIIDSKRTLSYKYHMINIFDLFDKAIRLL